MGFYVGRLVLDLLPAKQAQLTVIDPSNSIAAPTEDDLLYIHYRRTKPFRQASITFLRMKLYTAYIELFFKLSKLGTVFLQAFSAKYCSVYQSCDFHDLATYSK